MGRSTLLNKTYEEGKIKGFQTYRRDVKDIDAVNLGEALSLDGGFVEKVIREENKRYFNYLDPLTECYNDLDLQRYAVVVGDVNYATSITRFLSDDLGWLPELIVFTVQLRDDQKELLSSLRDSLESGLKPRVVFETDTGEIIRYLNELYPKNSSIKFARYSNSAEAVVRKSNGLSLYNVHCTKIVLE